MRRLRLWARASHPRRAFELGFVVAMLTGLLAFTGLPLRAAESDQAEVPPRDPAGLQRELESLKARSALANAAWQERLAQASRTAEEELAALRGRLAQVEVEAKRAREALSAAEAAQPGKGQTGIVELIAQDVLALRQELGELKARVAPDPAKESSRQQQAPPQSTDDAADPVSVTGSLASSAQGAERRSEAVAPPPGPLLARADALLATGDVSGARSVLQLALQSGSAAAAFKLAETYDPRRLSSLRVFGLRPDPGKAQVYYQRAYELEMRQSRQIAR